MKVYLFNIDNGVYEGEAFFEVGAVREDAGMTINVPPDHRPGLIPVYDRSLGAWKLVHAAELRGKENGNV